MVGASLAAVLVLATSGLLHAIEPGYLPPPGMADLTTEQGFLPLPTDPRIRYEAGAAALAQTTARHLDDALLRVERAHGRPFRSPVEIRVCATPHSFLRLSSTALALTRYGRVYLSPGLFDDPPRVAGILTHELSHAHFAQHLGIEAAQALPTWFREGLAVQLAGGAGLSRVSRVAAVDAIRRGIQLVPESEWERRYPKSAADHGLEPAMFYRQSAMFVAYLERTEPEKFAQFLADLLDAVPFAEAFTRHYSVTPEQTWHQFVARLESTP